MPRITVGPLIREARARQRRSQLDLALDVGVSPRHLSFVELGKSRPSPELLTLIADRLGVPLRDRNAWLMAAGHAPAYRSGDLDGPELAHLRATLQGVIDAQDPFPAVVVDRRWTVQLTNDAAVRLAAGIELSARGGPTNIFRICLHPEGFAARTTNFAEWSAYLLRQLHHAVTATGDAELIALADEVETWPGIPPRTRWATLDAGTAWPVVPWRLRHDGGELSLLTVLSTFATPNDVTVAELLIETFLPADEPTAHALRAGTTTRP